jgi:predicted metalloprotease with PDZ domain
MTRQRASLALATLLVLLSCISSAQKTVLKAAAPPKLTVAVDATEAPRKIFHAKLTIPVTPGTATLYYPKWIPGEHGPTGPIADLTGTKFMAGGKELTWRRDPVDMYTLYVDVPQGVNSLDVSLDFLSPTEGQFSAGASATEKLTVVSWNTVLLYPKGWTSDQITVTPSLKLPAGWQYGTALEGGGTGDTLQFAPVSLTTLVDSPVLAGQYFKKFDLDGDLKHTLNAAADSAAALEAKPETIQHFKNLITETGVLYGARHYRHYDFLLTLSDHTAHFGLEHHESSDDRIPENGITDADAMISHSGLLPHEMTHSWNGKYRRPAGLATPDYQTPMKGDLLWVYEGMTQYWGEVLTARTGELTQEQAREELANVAGYLDHWPGRTWRPLQDTATAAQVLYGASHAWESWRRSVDYYDEMILVWLEADTIIRKQSNGTKSLDDFAKLFLGGKSGPPAVVPYTFEDVVKGLNQVAPYDWRTFLRTRLDKTGDHAPLGGIENSGWRLVYTDQESEYLKARERDRKNTVEWYSIGIDLESKESKGKILDTVKGMAAENAGIAPGMKVIAVNGREYSENVLRAAIKAAKGTSEPIDLLVENGEFYKTYKVDYHEGLKYPHLERDASKPDLLSDILRPHATAAAK